MTTMKRIFESVSENRDNQQLNKRIFLDISNKRDIWNGRRRFGY